MILSLAEIPFSRDSLLPLLLTAYDVVGIGLGLLVLYRRVPPDRPARSLRRDFRALVWGGVVLALVGAVLGIGVLNNKFAVLRFWHHAGWVIFAPLLVVRSIGYLRRKQWMGGLALMVTGLTVLGFHSWAAYVEPFRLETTRHVISSPRLAGLTEPVKVVLLADLQTDAIGVYEQRVFEQIAAEQADLILLAGDYLQIRSREVFAQEQEKLVELFEGLEPWPRLGVYAVDGDVDLAKPSLARTRIRCLFNQAVSLDGEPLQVIGLSCRSSREDLSEAMSQSIASFDGYTLVVGHAPDYMNMVIEDRSRPDAFMVAGHTHGGQVVVPGFGPPVTLSSVPRSVAAGGLHEYGATKLCVSRGVGLERGYAPRVRLFCRPELVVVELRAPE